MMLLDSFTKRSAKLLPCQKEMIVFWYNRGSTIKELSRRFNVSERTISFVLHPEKLQRAKEISREYQRNNYKKDVSAARIRDTREYKKKLYAKDSTAHKPAGKKH